MTQLYKLQYFSKARNKWVASFSPRRDTLASMKRLALEFTGIGSGLLTPMPYRAVPVKVAKKKTKSKEKGKAIKK